MRTVGALEGMLEMRGCSALPGTVRKPVMLELCPAWKSLGTGEDTEHGPHDLTDRTF